MGKILAHAADEIIAVGQNSAAISAGVEKHAAVVEVNNIEEAKIILNAKLKNGDAVLFLNDIPDRYGV